MKIKYIKYYYGKCRNETLHLIRYDTGQAVLVTDNEIVKMGLAKWKVSK